MGFGQAQRPSPFGQPAAAPTPFGELSLSLSERVSVYLGACYENSMTGT